MKIRDPKLPLFEVVEDGIVASPGFADGRFMPSLIVDFKGDSRIEQLLKLHQHAKPGDVTSQWAQAFSFGRCRVVVLNLEFTQPLSISFGLRFRIDREYALVDGIIHSRGLLLFSGKKGDSSAQHVMAGDGITVEVPNSGFDDFWEPLLYRTIKALYRVKGEPKRLSKARVRQHIDRMRQVWNHRQR